MEQEAFSLRQAADLLEDVRRRVPLVHNITNFVVMQVTANALLALGASPVMAHAEEEVEEITALSSALVLNIGTLSGPWIRAMHKALDAARSRKIPVLVDPVGAGASRMRTQTALDFLEKCPGALLRGNASEILALAGQAHQAGGPRGVDSTASSGEAAEAARYLARRYGCTVSVSGESDIVTDGERSCVIHGGSELMPRVTGMGCSASALGGAFAGVCGKGVEALASAMCCMAAAGSEAAGRAQGPGSFAPLFLDALYRMDAAMLERGAALEWARDGNAFRQ